MLASEQSPDLMICELCRSASFGTLHDQLYGLSSCPGWGRFLAHQSVSFGGHNENHPAPRLLRGPFRRRLDHRAVRVRRQCPAARYLGEDDQETGLPSRQDFCRQELYGRNGEVVTIGIVPAFLIRAPIACL
jgi:hypothetical protein